MITAQIASIPEREDMLRNTVASLFPQVDKLNVMLNAYERVPYFLKNGKIDVYRFDNTMGDAVKFYEVYEDGYVLTCDDDIIYPPDWVSTMTSHVAKTVSVATIIGKIFKPKPINTFYGTSDRLIAYHWNKPNNDFHRVQVGGTGVMCFHTDHFRPRYEDFTEPNMADVFIAKFAHEQGVPIMVVPHNGYWIDYQEPPLRRTIWGACYFGDTDDTKQTEIFNSF